MSTRTLEKRLSALARSRRFRPAPPPSPEDALFGKKVEELMARINPVHADHIRGELKGRYVRDYSNFTLEALLIVGDHITDNHPLALPDDVAQVYLGNERAYGGDACRGCGYRLPASHFNRCPLCGGEVS